MATSTYYVTAANSGAFKGTDPGSTTFTLASETAASGAEETNCSTDNTSTFPGFSSFSSSYRCTVRITEAVGSISQIDVKFRPISSGPAFSGSLTAHIWDDTNTTRLAAFGTYTDGAAASNLTTSKTTNIADVIDANGDFTVFGIHDSGGAKGSTALEFFEVVVTYSAGQSEFRMAGNGVDITAGDSTPSEADHTHFGNVVVGSYLERTYTIRNDVSAGADLTLDGSPIVEMLSSGEGLINPGFFTVTTQPASTTLAAEATTTLVIRFTPTVTGAAVGEPNIDTNDPDLAAPDNTYGIRIGGTGVYSNAARVAAQMFRRK